MSLDETLAVALRDDASPETGGLADAWSRVAGRAAALRRRRRIATASTVVVLSVAAAGLSVAWRPWDQASIRPTVSPTPGTVFVGNDPNGFSGAAEKVSPSPGFAYRLSPQRWSRAIVVDERTLDVYYASGLKNCFVLREVRVAEDPNAVTITLIEGTITTACRLPGFFYQTRVTLTQPIGERAVVDGAPPQPR